MDIPATDGRRKTPIGADELAQWIRVARGELPPDLLLKNGRLLNVHTLEIHPADVAIVGGRIVAVREDIEAMGADVVDVDGAYLAPGYMDPHMHIETTFVSPRQLARAIVPLGTTTLFADGTDVSYVAGVKSVRTQLDATKHIPLRVYLEAPSYSAFLPGLQTTGGAIGLKEVEEMLSWPETVSLGEIVATKILELDREYLEEIAASRAVGVRLNAHTALNAPRDLDAVVAVGMSDDHTVARPDQILPRLRRGMTLFLVDAPGRRHLSEFVRHIIDAGLPTDRVCFCIDNTSILDIVEDDYGYMDYLIKIAVEEGLEPVHAVQMATLNPARYFKLDGEIGSIAPGRYADVLILESLTDFRPQRVYFEGELVAENGALLQVPDPFDYPSYYLNSIELHRSLRPASLVPQVSESATAATVLVLELNRDDEQADNRAGTAELAVEAGVIQPDLQNDTIYLSVVERYGKNGNVGHGFCRGSGLRSGAIATSLSISDSNIVVLGCDVESMWTAVQEVARIQGGAAVAQGGEVLKSCALRLGGQMTDEPYEELIVAMKGLVAEARRLGSTLTNPILTLASTVLMSIPDLGLTDTGYVDARTGKRAELVIEIRHFGG